MKRAFAVTALVCALALNVTSEPNKAPADNQQSAQPKSPASIAPENNNVTTNYAEYPNNDAPQWRTAIKRPEWWLVIIAALTGIAIAYQARESANATKAARDSIRLQEVALRQWLNVDNWEIWLKNNSKQLRMRFQIINPTHLPVDLRGYTLETAIMNAASEKESVPFDQVLPPDNPRIVESVIEFGEKWTDVFTPKNPIVISVKCVVFFTDVRDKKWEQTFERYVVVGNKLLMCGDDPYVPHVRPKRNYLRPEED